jgi:hypothetical protein
MGYYVQNEVKDLFNKCFMLGRDLFMIIMRSSLSKLFFLSLLLLSFNSTFFYLTTVAAAQPKLKTSRVWVTDVTPQAFSLVWFANQAATGSVNVYSDYKGNNLIQGLVITDDSANHPPAGDSGVIKITISNLNSDTIFYFQVVTTTNEDVLIEPAKGKLPSVRTEVSSTIVNNDLIANRILQNDGTTPALGALLVADVRGSDYPITGWVDEGVPAPWALLDLNNFYSKKDHKNLELVGKEIISLRSLGGIKGFKPLRSTVPDEIGGIQILDPTPDDGQCTLDTLKPKFAVDFGALGLYEYDGGSWAKISTANGAAIERFCGDLVADFDTSGFYTYDGLWTRISSGNAEEISVACPYLFVDFGVAGLWEYQNGKWGRISSANPEGLETYDNKLAADFGLYGLYEYDGAWTRISSGNCEGMKGAGSDLYADFGNSGLWKKSAGIWTMISNGNSENLATYDNKLVADFGLYGLYEYDGSWTRISTGDAENLVGADLDLYADFGDSGIWQYNGTWIKISNGNPEALETYDNKLMADFGLYGLYEYDGAWTRISMDNSEDMEDVSVF